MAQKETAPDKIQLYVVIDGSPARKELAELTQASVKLKQEQKALREEEKLLKQQREAAAKVNDTAQVAKMNTELQRVRKSYADVGDAMKVNTQQQETLRAGMGTMDLSLGELRKKLQTLRAAWTAGIGSKEELQDLNKQLTETENRIQALSTAQGRALIQWEQERKAIDRTKWSVEQLALEQKRLQTIYDKTPNDSAEKLEAAAALDKVNEELRQQTTEAGRAAQQWERLRGSIAVEDMTGDQLKQEAQYLEKLAGGMNQAQREAAGLAPRMQQVNERLQRMNTEAGRAASEWERVRGTMTLDEMTGDQLKLEAQYLERLTSSMNQAEVEAAGLGPRLSDVRERLRLMNTEAGRAEAAWQKMRGTMTLDQMTGDQLKMEAQYLQKLAMGMSQAEQVAAGLPQRINEVNQRLAVMNTEAGRSRTAWAQLREGMRLEDMSIEQLKQEKQYLEELLNTARRSGGAFDALEKDLMDVDRALKLTTSDTERSHREWEKMRTGMKVTQMTMKELEREIEFLKRAKAGIRPEEDARKFDIYSRALKTAEERQKQLTTGMGPFARMWQEAKVQMVSAGAVLGGLFAGSFVMDGFRNMIRSSAELSDSISDVKKTTGLTTPVVKELVKEMGGLDTRTSRNELLALARDAGKLGLSAKEDVMSFVRAGNQINVALGEDLGKGAIQSIGKLVDLFSLKKEFGLEQSMLKVGSALNELGMASTANEGYMVEFLKRMGGIAPLAGITIDQTLALGATLDSLGQTSEVSSTALSKLFVDLGRNAERYAGLAGMSVEKFKDILSKNALEAFIKVLEGTKKTEGGVMALAETLGDMGIDASRAAGVFGVLSNNTERLGEQMVIAKRAFQEGSSITEEYTEKNTNLAATLEKLQKEFNRLLANNTVIEWMTGLVEAAKTAIGWLERNATAIGNVAKILAVAGTAWATYRLAGLLWLRLAAMQATATAILSNAKNLLSANTITAGRAYLFFSNALKTSLPGLIATAVVGLAAAFAGFGKELSAAAINAARETTALQALYIQIITTNKGTDERRKLIDQLKAQYPEYLSQLNSDTVSNEALGKAVAYVNDQLINKAVLARADERLQEQNAQAAERRMDRLEKERELRDALAEASETSGVAIPVIPGADLMQTANAFLEMVKQADAFNNKTAAASVIRNELFWAIARENKEMKEGNRLMELRMELEKALGIASTTARDNATRQWTRMGEITTEIARLQEELLSPKTDPTSQTLIRAQIKALEAERAQLQLVAKDTAEEAIRTVEWYNREIAKAKERQRDAARTGNSQLFDDIGKEISELEKMRDALMGDKKSKQRREKTVEDLDKLLEEYKRFQTELLSSNKSADEQALAELRSKHDKELAEVIAQQQKLIKAKKLSETDALIDRTIVTDRQQREEVNLIEGQAEDRMKPIRERNEKIQAALGEHQNKLLQANVAYYTKEIELAQESGKDATDLIRQRHNAEIALYEQNAKDLLAQEIKKYNDLIALAKQRLEEFDQKNAANGIENTDEVLQERKALSDAVIAAEQAQKDAVMAIRRSEEQETRAMLKRMTLEVRQEYAKRLQGFAQVASSFSDLATAVTQYQDAGIAAAEQRAQQDEVLTEEELANINRLKAERREAALLAIKLQGAVAIANGVAQAMTLPFPANLAAAASTVATVIGLIAQARALMNEANDSQNTARVNNRNGVLENVPLGADGLVNKNNRVITSREGGGVLGGNLHTDGGNDVVDRKTGKVLANVERDELMLVMSRRATEQNKDLIPMLMQASREGKRITPFSRPLTLPDPTRSAQALRVVHMAQGGALFGGQDATTNNGERAGDNQVVALLAQLNNLMGQVLTETRRTSNATERFPTELKAKVGVVDMQRSMSEYETILAKSKARKRA